MKKIILLSFLMASIGACGYANAQSMSISTDAYDNNGTALMAPIKPKEDKALLPHVMKSYIPTGGFTSNIGGGANIANAPDIGMVEKVLIYLAQAFQAKDGGTGSMLWKISMAVTYIGLLLSGFLTFQAVSQGRKSPAEGLVAIITKIVITLVLFSYVVPNVPPMLIGLSDQITDGVDTWFNGAAGSAGNAAGTSSSIDAMQQIFYSKRSLARTAALRKINTLLGDAAVQLDQDPRGQAIINQIKSELDNSGSVIGKNIDKGQDATEWAAIKSKADSNAGVGDINNLISGSCGALLESVVKELNVIVNNNMAGNLSQGDQVIKAHLASGITQSDISPFTYPGRLEAAEAYTAFAYLAISIWGMGIAALVWMMLYALPEEWQMGGVLFSGLKAGMAVVLAIVLVSIYVTATLTTNTAQTAAANTSALSGVKDFISGLASGASAVWNPGSWWKNITSGLSHILNENLIMGALIMTAPAQAAAMVKGANGIAEHAKNAVQTAAGQGVAGAFGTHNASSGATAASGSGSIADPAPRSWMQGRVRDSRTP
jgi:hypothetical protein